MSNPEIAGERSFESEGEREIRFTQHQLTSLINILEGIVRMGPQEEKMAKNGLIMQEDMVWARERNQMSKEILGKLKHSGDGSGN
jgi:hypothetical protein